MFCVKCGKENPDSGSFCWSCGSNLFRDPSHTSQNIVASEPTQTALRQGRKLIVPRDAVLPHVCIKCGASGFPYVYKFSWLSEGYYALVLLGILPYFLVRLLLRKTFRLLVPLCERHHRRVHALGVASVVALVAAIPTAFAVGSVFGNGDGTAWGLASFASLVVAGLVLLWAYAPLRAVHIDKRQATFYGACGDFLKLLPDLPKQ
jgi:ribosomal protein L40E